MEYARNARLHHIGYTRMMYPLQVLAVAGMIMAWSAAARAEVDVEAVLLLGSGVDTGNAGNNPYLLQIGGALELTLASWVAGVRVTRAEGFQYDCDPPPGGECPPMVPGVRTFGVDLGADWELGMVHLSPRFGLGLPGPARR